MADGKITIETGLDLTGIDKGIKDMQKKLNESADKLKSTGTTMTKSVTAPIVAMGTMAFASADQIDKAFREIRVGTGATGDDLELLKKSFEDVFVGVPDSAEDVATSLANLNTFTGYTGDSLTDLTQQVLDASRTMGESGVDASEAFGKALNNWNIPAEEAGGHLDHMYNLSQTYGVGISELSVMTTKHGTALKNAGFEMNEVAHWMAALEANGIQVSRIMPGLNKATRDWADEGKNSREELNKTIKAMQNAESDTEALAIAMEVFGSQGAQRMTDAVRNGALPALSDLGNMFDESSGLIAETTEDTRTIGEEFQILKNNVTLALEPLGKILIEMARDFLPPLIEKVTELGEWFRNLSPGIQKVIVVIGGILAVIGPLLVVLGTVIGAVSKLAGVFKLLGGAIAFLTSPIGLIIVAIGAVIGILVYLWNTSEGFRNAVISIWEGIKEIITVAVDAIVAFVMDIWGALVTFWEENGQILIDNVVNVWEFIKPFIETYVTGIWETIKNIFGFIVDTIKIAWDTIVGVFQGAVDVIMGIVQFFGALFTGNWSEMWEATKRIFGGALDIIKSIVGGVFNQIKNVISTVINSIKITISTVWNIISGLTSNIWNGIWGGIKSVTNNIWNGIKNVFNGIRDTISGVWNGIKETTDKIWDGIVNTIKGAINGVIAVINGMLGAIGKINIKTPKIPSWVPKFGGKQMDIGFPNLPKIPSLDVGTNFVAQDGLAFLHKGEAVVPKKYNPAVTGKGSDVNITVQEMHVRSEEDIYKVSRQLKRLQDRASLSKGVGGVSTI